MGAGAPLGAPARGHGAQLLACAVAVKKPFCPGVMGAGPSASSFATSAGARPFSAMAWEIVSCRSGTEKSLRDRFTERGT